MKDTKFIELLNLYLDHELTPADCAKLEAEVKANPARRRTYEQYCRMQQGCKALAADFAAEAPLADARALRSSGAPSAPRHPIGLFAVGTLTAAAAAVAFLIVARPAPTAPDRAPMAQQASIVADATPEAPARAAGGIVQRAALMGDSIIFVRAPATNEAVAPQLAWIKDLQLAPLQPVVSADALRFETKLINTGTEVRVHSPLRVREKTEHTISWEARH